MKIRCSMHTHTTFCDGKHTPREMVEAAIELGCTTLGFSGHSPMGVAGAEEWTMRRERVLRYVDEINRLKDEYKDRIEILAGIEQDYFSGTRDPIFDYAIGSVHGIRIDGDYFNVDNTPEEFTRAVDKYYDGNVMGAVRDYYALVTDVVDKTKCDIIGHFDLVTKFNEKCDLFDTTSKEYRTIALEALDALIEKKKIFEINTGAISRGWRTKPYPEDFLLKRLVEKGADLMITSDSHHKDTILFAYEDAIEYARSCGVKQLCVYKSSKIEKISI